MMLPRYHAQVDLLLQLLPHIAKEPCFALKGGTAINLFIRDLPRLSVDIDLTYLPFEDRQTALARITEALQRVKSSIERTIPNATATIAPQSGGQDAKLLCRVKQAQVKIEVNTVIRGQAFPCRIMDVAPLVETTFKRFASMQVVSEAELFGGKVCAALDRQHPRDLFDIHQMMQFEGFREEVRQGFIIALLSHGRPMHEVLNPRLLDQSHTFKFQFLGMTMLPFDYADFENTRTELLSLTRRSFKETEREFLLSFKRGEPDWKTLPIQTASQMPAIKWKLSNIQKLCTHDPQKHRSQFEKLEQVLSES
jgi:predicted nucleotidyltransferase component of viral defense system